MHAGDCGCVEPDCEADCERAACSASCAIVCAFAAESTLWMYLTSRRREDEAREGGEQLKV